MIAVTIFLLSTLVPTFGSPLMSRDVWNPPITSPNAKTLWKVGDKVAVTWDISNMPPVGQLTNPTSTVLLGFLDGEGENLMIDSPLAQGFNLSDTQVQITVPSVPTRNNYIVVVLGDSGNASPEFTIEGVGSVSSSTTVGTSQVSPTITGTTTTQTGTSSATISSSASVPTPTATVPASSSGTTSSASSAPTSSGTSASSASTSSGTTSSASSAPTSSSSSSTSAGLPQSSQSSAWMSSPIPVTGYSLVATVLTLLVTF